MKKLAGLLAGLALVCTPMVAEARGGAGGGGHGGVHASGGFRGGFGGGFHGGYRGGYRGGWGYRGGYGWGGWGWPYYGAALGLYLGYYDDPWYWGYPGYYYGYAPYAVAPYPDAPPVAKAQPAPSASQVCGNWQWGQADQQYHWVTNGCN